MTRSVCISAWLFVMVACATEDPRKPSDVVEQTQPTDMAGETQPTAVMQQTQPSVADAGFCEDATSAVRNLLNRAVEAAPKACSTDDQCVLFSDAICLAGCGFYVAVTDATGIQEAIQTTRTEFCAHVCPEVPPPCDPGVGEPTARCVTGECALVY